MNEKENQNENVNSEEKDSNITTNDLFRQVNLKILIFHFLSITLLFLLII
jgi:hypothetical protein